jgi:hypothetical protein
MTPCASPAFLLPSRWNCSISASRSAPVPAPTAEVPSRSSPTGTCVDTLRRDTMELPGRCVFLLEPPFETRLRADVSRLLELGDSLLHPEDRSAFRVAAGAFHRHIQACRMAGLPLPVFAPLCLSLAGKVATTHRPCQDAASNDRRPTCQIRRSTRSIELASPHRGLSG